MGWFKNKILKWLGIIPADEKNITIRESFTHTDYVLMNRIWYRADPNELSQFYKSLGPGGANDSRFWYITPPSGQTIRKIHTGLPQLIINMLTDIVIDDSLGVSLVHNDDVEGNAGHTKEEIELWEEITKDNNFFELIKDATKEVLIVGDGAFKLSIDTEISKYPIIEFYAGSDVDYKYKRGRLMEVIFKTEYRDEKDDEYTLEEYYGKGYVKYKLFNDKGAEVPLHTIDELKGLVDVTFEGDYIMAVPLKVIKSSKYKNRGQSIIDGKYDSFDALDEVVSEWLDAIRLGRAEKWIPEDLIPRDKDGNMMPYNPITNQHYTLEQPMEENAKIIPTVVQPDIAAEPLFKSYCQYLDMCLMGVVSPSTLGIDVKKLDNSEAQREKEKATLYTRNKIISALTEVIPKVADITMKTYDQMYSRATKHYLATIEFGEYANPSFEAVVETIGKARMNQIMSFEMCVEQLYGDTLSEEEKEREVALLKEQFNSTNEYLDFMGMDRHNEDDEEEEAEDKELGADK